MCIRDSLCGEQALGVVAAAILVRSPCPASACGVHLGPSTGCACQFHRHRRAAPIGSGGRRERGAKGGEPEPAQQTASQAARGRVVSRTAQHAHRAQTPEGNASRAHRELVELDERRDEEEPQVGDHPRGEHATSQ
eukprot:1902059-Prymnesium_polylepis.1